MELCQIATANIIIDDFNDHTPKFDKNSYTFRIDNFPYNNTEVGTLKAIDKDKVIYKIKKEKNKNNLFRVNLDELDIEF